MWEYPFVITFNGDDFDLRYLARRAQNFDFRSDEIPVGIGRRVCLLKYGVHIDLYKFFFNRAIQIYAFNNRYRDVALNDVGKALIGMEKIKLEKGIGELTYTELAKYCLRDSEITFKLTSFEDDSVMKLMLVLARISSMPMEDVSRQGVSRWIRNFMHHEHRRRNMLIPNTEDILARKGKTSTVAIIKGKKYKGAIVVEPVPGIHFNVAVMDFPSLYPSIIKVWNLGYQSIRCLHPECKDNTIPGTTHWVCKKKRALESLLIGSLRDLRVHWYKPKSKDESLPEGLRNWYRLIQGALKVILNASYGTFGAESFDLYCPPVAEATAAVGRHLITKIINKARELGIQVLYGDTDSVFLKHPTREQTDALMEWADEALGIDLEVEKTYRYAIFSERKKNYLGVYKDGRLDIKGLTGKKRHIPPILKAAFDELTAILSNVQTQEEFPQAKEDIKGLVEEVHRRLKERDFGIEEVAFQMQLGKDLSRYETNPQHVKVGKMLVELGHEIVEGDIISYVVTKDNVLPAIVAKPRDVDVNKYEDYLEGTFEQLLDALDMSFDALVGRPQQTSLGAFFG